MSACLAGGVSQRLLEEDRRPTAAEQDALEQAFSRSGFTDWYWQGKHGAGMFGVRPENAPDPKALFDAAKTSYEKDDLRTSPVRLTCAIRAGEPCALTASDGTHTVTVTGPVPEAARNRALVDTEIADRLKKTGGTAFRCESVEVTVDEGLSLPASAINALRLSRSLMRSPPNSVRRHIRHGQIPRIAYLPQRSACR